MLALLAGAAQPLGSATARPAAEQQGLLRTNREFLEAVEEHRPEPIMRFFPTAGSFTYRHTLHTDEGDSVTIRRFAAGAARREITNGALWTSFDIQYEHQPIGLFAHQVLNRGTSWRRVRGTRFVPPDADATSGIFVEWRREGRRWGDRRVR